MNDKKDDLFSKPKSTEPFIFDRNVAEVFPDMIKRSVPGYQLIIETLPAIANRYVKTDTQCYDLGCSLGAASLAVASGIQPGVQAKIIGIDNSDAMLERCEQHINVFKHETPIELLNQDIATTEIDKASLVILNFTLQFIARGHRTDVIKNIYDGLIPGGALVLSEKIKIEDETANELIIDLHHDFKKSNGYSELEVSQKRNALENVLLPDTITEHQVRLKKAGFKHVTTWMQQYNFVSFLAIK